jgi:quinol monooxygenase YgiN
MTGKLLVVGARVQAQAGKENDLREALRALIGPTRQEAGCVQYDLHEDLDQPGSFLFFEKWTSKQALDAHLAMPYVKAMFARVPELVQGEPVIALYEQIG